MKEKRVTLRQLATICDLSVSTVSQILNDRDTYSTEKTKETVRETAKKLGYRPNIGYKLMHGISTKTIAIVLCYSEMTGNEYIQKIIIGLIESLNEKGYYVYTVAMPNKWSERKQTMEKILERGVESLICLWHPCEWEDLAEIARKIPTVVMSGGNVPSSVNSVNIDVVYGVTKLLEHFREAGCRNIRMISMPEDGDRLKAFSKFMNLDQSKLAPYLIPLIGADAHTRQNELHPERSVEIGYRLTMELLKKSPETDAIFYFTDLYALGGAKYLLESGRQIGKDIRIAGYNNTTAVRCFPYPISSVGQNEEEIVSLLLELSQKTEAKHILVKPEIFIRD